MALLVKTLLFSPSAGTTHHSPVTWHVGWALRGLVSAIEQLDRRWVFLFVGIGALVPVILPLGLPTTVTPEVRSLFDRIAELEPGDVVLLSFDYGPSSAPELDPMAEAILRHCFAREVRVLAISLFALGGETMGVERLRTVTREFDLTDGEEYVFLGFKSGGQAVMKRMAEDIAGAFPQDAVGRPIREIPLMREVRNYSDVELAVSFATGMLGEYWANLVNPQFGVDVAVGCTAVSAPRYYAYLKSGQMFGLLGGLKGASEYEELLTAALPDIGSRSRAARKGMDVQSVVHAIIILFIVLGNVAYLVARRSSGGGSGSRP
jgi:hypothetical protein